MPCWRYCQKWFNQGRSSQVPQPLLLVVGWVYNTQKTVNLFFASFHRVHLVSHCQVSWGTWLVSVAFPPRPSSSMCVCICVSVCLSVCVCVCVWWSECSVSPSARWSRVCVCVCVCECLCGCVFMCVCICHCVSGGVSVAFPPPLVGAEPTPSTPATLLHHVDTHALQSPFFTVFKKALPKFQSDICPHS